jgi:hypothetical protein
VTIRFVEALTAYTKDFNKIWSQITYSVFLVLHGTKMVAAWMVLCFKTQNIKVLQSLTAADAAEFTKYAK